MMPVTSKWSYPVAVRLVLPQNSGLIHARVTAKPSAVTKSLAYILNKSSENVRIVSAKCSRFMETVEF